MRASAPTDESLDDLLVETGSVSDETCSKLQSASEERSVRSMAAVKTLPWWVGCRTAELGGRRDRRLIAESLSKVGGGAFGKGFPGRSCENGSSGNLHVPNSRRSMSVTPKSRAHQAGVKPLLGGYARESPRSFFEVPHTM